MTQTPKPPAPKRWTQIHERLTWPIIAMATFAGISAVPQIPAPWHDGCDDRSRNIIKAGELALYRGDMNLADASAAQALAISPGCKCAAMLTAQDRFAQMEIALKSGKADMAEADRRSCFEYAMRASDGFNRSPQLAALVNACSVVTDTVA